MNSLSILLWIIPAVLIIGTPLALYIMAVQSRTGEAPGLVNNRLSQCSTRPNCVTSEYADDFDHYIEPIQLPGPISDSYTLGAIKRQITELNGEVQQLESDYLAATFRSSLFGFIDDLEVRVDRNRHVLHIRSASRVGWSDGGINRKRVKKLRTRLHTKIKSQIQH